MVVAEASIFLAVPHPGKHPEQEKYRLLNRRKNTQMSHFFYGGMLHEYSLVGLYFSPMALFSMLALISTLITRKILTALKLRQLVWAGAWFDLSVYMIYLAATVYFIGV
ncbi:DUF1656 domain-containing protein [Klebsiella aerogenes]|uniref:DUF1656 domain-containing protein n=1 Tax=Klebsiella aerogenes TaxID=548 RepID=UPI001BD03F31|nr:DUF1656 domain-containing protein [Klebsiella aerogenes]